MSPNSALATRAGAKTTVLASFIIMLCLGGVYAWSIFVPELKNNYGFSSTQVQLIFGVLIAIFPTTMVFAGKLEHRFKPRTHGIISALLFSSGYLLSGFSNGNFYLILIGIGLLAGIGTGFGYLAALTTPVKWFPDKRGMVTGIVAAGFGLAAVLLSTLIELLLKRGFDVLEIFTLIGIVYGSIILFFALLMKKPNYTSDVPKVKISFMLGNKQFLKSVAGVFFGTFAGLLIIGNLSSIGAEYQLEAHTLVIGVSFFAIANFTGRLSWGFLSDHFNAARCITIALLFQAAGIFLIGFIQLTPFLYILLSFMIGFGFGGNFVLFAKVTSQTFGLANLGIVYPYVFLGYGAAGIFGPLTGGMLYDHFQNFNAATYIAALMSVAGAVLYLFGTKQAVKSSPENAK